MSSIGCVTDVVTLTLATHPDREGNAEGIVLDGIIEGTREGANVGDEVRYSTQM